MGSLSVWHWLMFLAVALLMFRRQRQDLLDHGRRGQGHQELQEGHGGGRRAGQEGRAAEGPRGRGASRPSSTPAAEPNKAGWSAKS